MNRVRTRRSHKERKGGYGEIVDERCDLCGCGLDWRTMIP
jgi:hypothetical protein